MQKTHIDKDKLEKAVSALVESEEVELLQTPNPSHKTVKWIVLRQLNKSISRSLEPIRYEENKDSKDIKDSINTKNSKNSLNSLDTTGIPASFAIIAKNASFAKNANDCVDGDGEPASPNPPGLAEFKKKVKAYSDRRTCASCGQKFEQPLVIHGIGGYICARCHREGPPTPPQQADTQTKLN